jgi:hypothetical protein
MLPALLDNAGSESVAELEPEETRSTDTIDSVPEASISARLKGSLRDWAYWTWIGMSELRPQTKLMGAPVDDGIMYHVPLDGRKTATSIFPSPS